MLADATQLGQLLYFGRQRGRDFDGIAIRCRHGRRYWLLHVEHSARHPRLFDAGPHSFRYRAITGIVLVPWPSSWPIAIIFGLGGLTGLAYQTTVVVQRHKVGLVLLNWHDWLPYAGIPALGSMSLVVGAVGLITEKSFAPYAIAGATTLLLFAGVYGAWDLTLWIIKNRDKTVIATR